MCAQNIFLLEVTQTPVTPLINETFISLKKVLKYR